MNASKEMKSLLSLPASRPRRRATRDLPVTRLPEWARWETRPQDRGQFVLVSYATDGTYLYQSVYDQSDRSQSYYRKKISAKADLERDMDVPNGDLPKTIGKWQKVHVEERDY